MDFLDKRLGFCTRVIITWVQNEVPFRVCLIVNPDSDRFVGGECDIVKIDQVIPVISGVPSDNF